MSTRSAKAALNPVSDSLLDNDSDPDVTDTISVTDIDGVIDPAIDIAGNFGTLNWNTDGSYSYTLDNLNPAVVTMLPTDTLTEMFTYSIDDGNGGSGHIDVDDHDHRQRRDAGDDTRYAYDPGGRHRSGHWRLAG